MIHFVIVTGGWSTGLEIWNMASGSVEIIVDILPTEKKYGWSTYGAKIISINDNTELVFFGGWPGIMLTEVWKYNYPRNTWTLVGNIQVGRQHHLAIPVKGMECP